MTNRVSSYFPKGGHSVTAKNNMNTHKLERHRNFDTKNSNREQQQNYNLGMSVINYLGVGFGGGGA